MWSELAENGDHSSWMKLSCRREPKKSAMSLRRKRSAVLKRESDWNRGGKKQPESRREELGERREGGEQWDAPILWCVSRFLRKYSLGYLMLAQVWAGFKCSWKWGNHPAFSKRHSIPSYLGVGASFYLSPLPTPRTRGTPSVAAGKGEHSPWCWEIFENWSQMLLSSFSGIKCGNELLCQHISEKESEQGHILCVARPT